jgi:hypothetical protein
MFYPTRGLRKIRNNLRFLIYNWLVFGWITDKRIEAVEISEWKKDRNCQYIALTYLETLRRNVPIIYEQSLHLEYLARVLLIIISVIV